MLDFLFKLLGAAVFRIAQEVRALEDIEIISIGIADDDDIAADDPADDVYATTIGFSRERGRLNREV